MRRSIVGISALTSITSFYITHYLTKIALDREPPKIAERAGEKISGTLVDEQFLKLHAEAEEKLLNAETQEIHLVSHDGIELVGHWRPAKHPKRIVIAMHGWRSSWSRDYGIVADFLYDKGCSVLYAEQRGQNNSGGEYMGFGATERYDCLHWIHWVNQEIGSTMPIYLCGISMGATTVLMASALELPSNVCGIIADCGFTSADEIWEHVARNNLHLPYTLHRPVARKLYEDKNQLDGFRYSTVDALAQAKVPVLFIHGTHDHFVPVEMTYRNYLACSSPKHLLIVPGAEHAMSYIVDPKGYQNSVKDFWKEYDTKVSKNH